MIRSILFLIFFTFANAFLPSLAFSQNLETKFFDKFTPKIASIKTSRANLRYGPGKHYPIKWVYIKKNWPLIIIDQLEHWRKVQTVNNVKGWFHNSQLSKQKTSLIVYSEYLRKKPNMRSRKIALLKKGLIVDIIKCRVHWCKIETKEQRFSGWYVKIYLWGSDLLG